MLYKSKIESVQALRALAILVVVYHHAILSSKFVYGLSWQTNFYYLRNWGGIGVDLFFCISGFIMTRVAGKYRGATGAGQFVLNRFVRIAPLYWGLTLVAVFMKLVQHAPVELLEVGKAFYFLPLFETTHFVFPIINGGWTLSLEIYFYALIGLLLVANPRALFGRLAGLLVLIVVTGLAARPESVMGKFLSSPFLVEFALGVLCGVLYDRLADAPRLMWGLVVIGSLLALGNIFWMSRALRPIVALNNNQEAMLRVLLAGLPCAMLLLGSLGLEKFGRIRVSKKAVLLGDTSYSNYLLHQFVLNLATKAGITAGLASSVLPPLLYVALLTLFCMAVSIPFYRRVEVPMTAWAARLVSFRLVGTRPT